MPQNCVAICEITNHSGLFIFLSLDRECVMLALDKSNSCASPNAFIIIIIIYYYLSSLPCVMFFPCTKNSRCFPSAWVLNFRSQKKEKKKEIKKKEWRNAQRVWEWHWPSCRGMCMHELSATRASGFSFPQALGWLEGKAPGTAMDVFTRAQVLGQALHHGNKGPV